MIDHFHKTLYLVFGLLCTVLALLGAFLPVLPTTPLLIVAAFCFSRSSERLHRWLLNQEHFGPLLQDWEQYGVIPLRAKQLATLIIVISVGYPLVFLSWSVILKLIVTVTVGIGLSYIWTRPSVPGSPR